MKTFKQFLVEAELFDIKTKKDLVEWKYQEFNEKYFDSKLPADCRIEYKKMSKVTASANCQRDYISVPGDGYTRREIPVYRPGSAVITFNPVFKYSNEKFEGILLHEMIHLYVRIVLNKSWVRLGNKNLAWALSHGQEFETKRTQIEKESGITIPLRDEDEMNEYAKEKEVLTILFHSKYSAHPDRPSFFFLKPSTDLDFILTTMENSQRFARFNLDKVQIYKGITGFTSEIPVTRSLNGMPKQSWSLSNPWDYKVKLLKDQTLVKEKNYGD